MPSTGPRGKQWCFTLNNYTPDDVDRLSTPIDCIDYMIFGKERGESGTDHLQGVVVFKDRFRMSQVKQIIGTRAHVELTKKLENAIEYCRKEGDVTEWGEIPEEKSGQRTDIELFKIAVKGGMVSLAELREHHSDVCARYPRFVADYVRDNKPAITVEPHPLRPWQQTLYNRLINEPDKRKIIFIVDHQGNSGKSWFARYYTDLHENSMIVIPGKKADMAYTIRDDCKVFFFDCPRSKQGDFIQYDFLEELKNGLIFSPKYESQCKKLKTPHVVVCMNEQPDRTKLSDDRWDVTVLN